MEQGGKSEEGGVMVAETDLIAFVAEVLGVDADRLTVETTYGSIPEWDSMAQLRLVTGVASKYGVEIPFADVVKVTSIWEFLRRLNGGAVKKALAVDLDNTLWSGVVGEDGADGITHDVGLQRRLRALKERGVLLVVLSKNNLEDALAGMRGMAGLSVDDFVTWRIDWNSKADNLVEVAKELNIGIDSFVFLDDNPAERLEMAARLPEVAIAGSPSAVEAYFPERELTAEDLVRTEQYRAEALRRDYLGDLKVWVKVHELQTDEASRVAQLSQKANQFNVLTHRYSELDIKRIADEPTSMVVTAHAGDRFGDQGLVSFVVIRGDEIVDWVMSCRVMGRGVEDRVAQEVERIAKGHGLARLRAGWRDSGKNAPVMELFDRLGFVLTGSEEGERRYERVLG